MSIHIPVYLMIFTVGLIYLLTIFTFRISIALLFIDSMTIILSGLIGLGGIIRSVRENRMTKGIGILFSILQFVFCVDIIVAIVAYIMVKKNEERK